MLRVNILLLAIIFLPIHSISQLNAQIFAELPQNITNEQLDSDSDSLTNNWEINHQLNPYSALGDDGAEGDPDQDGLTNANEQIHATNPRNPDSDADGLNDGWEVRYGLNPTSALGDHGATGDADRDGLTNQEELFSNTYPNNPDTDGDGLRDGWEVDHQFSPINATGYHGASGDVDTDNLTNLQEQTAATNPRHPDSDGDALPDGLEIEHGSNPLDCELDADADGLENQPELALATNPFNSDSDGDGLPDGWEVAQQLNPLSVAGIHGANGDGDADGLGQLQEYLHQTNPHQADSDGDGLIDGWEVQHDLNPLSSLADDGANADPDSDSLSNLAEQSLATNPHSADSDHDQLPDAWEVQQQLDPLLASGEVGTNGDPDADRLTNLAEYRNSTRPLLADSDSDGLADGWEVQYTLDPLDGFGLNGATGDPDGDGMNNLVELQRQTHPLQATYLVMLPLAQHSY